MAVVLTAIALAMVAAGGWAVVEGYGIILNERGWTYVIAGTVAATGGLLLLGIATLAARLGRIQRELAKAQERAARLDLPAPPVRTSAPEPAGAAPARPLASEVPGTATGPGAAAFGSDVPALRGTTSPEADMGAPQPAAEPTVVGTYRSGGNAYVMFSDGSIEAETPTGRYRFKSLDELKEFIAAGGEEGGNITQ